MNRQERERERESDAAAGSGERAAACSDQRCATALPKGWRVQHGYVSGEHTGEGGRSQQHDSGR